MASPARRTIFAALGDVHGRLDAAVAGLRAAERAVGEPIAFVLQVGDLEAHRNSSDLASMYAPHRRKQVGEFPGYLQGRKRLPWPVHFIGGNHESYARLRPAPQGLTIAANLHYLGSVGWRDLHGLRVAYLSGVHDPRFLAQRPSLRPSEEDPLTQRALACFTAEEAESLREGPRPHVLLLHEWPLGLVRPADHEHGSPPHRHLRFGETGVPLLRELAVQVAPRLLLCGHLHRRYQAQLLNRHGEMTDVHCLGRADDGPRGCALFAFDGEGVDWLGPAIEEPRRPPGRQAANELLRRITYPSTHQYTVGPGGSIVLEPKAAARIRDLEAVLPRRSWTSLIDIGCAKGMFLLWAWSRFGLRRLLGIEPSPEMAEAARAAATALDAPAEILAAPPGRLLGTIAAADLVLVLHCYHYLYLGSDIGIPGIPRHDFWFDFFASITKDTLVFANDLELSEPQRQRFLELGAPSAEIGGYRRDRILSSAGRHFELTFTTLGGGRPYVVMRRRRRRGQVASAGGSGRAG